MFPWQPSKIGNAILGICSGILAVDVGGAASLLLSIAYPGDYFNIPIELFLATASTLIGGFLTGLLLRNSPRVVQVYSSALLMLAVTLNFWYMPVRLWGWIIVPSIVAGPVGMILSQIPIRSWQEILERSSTRLPLILFALILILGLYGAARAVPYFTDPDRLVFGRMYSVQQYLLLLLQSWFVCVVIIEA